MPRGRKKKFRLHLNVRTDTLRSVVAMLFVLLALISLLSFFVPEYSFNARVLKIQRELLGNAAILFPIILGLTGFVFIDKMQPRFKEIRTIISFVLLTICLAGLFHVFNKPEEFFDIAKKGEGGGLVGYKIATLLITSISVYGAVPVLFIIGIIALFILFNFSWDQVFKFVEEHKPNINFENFKLSLPVFKKGEEAVDGDIEVSQGFLTEEENPAVPEPKHEEEPLPSFEILPSMVEPQQLSLLEKEKTAEALYSVAPHYPKLPPDKIWQTPPYDLLIEPPSEIRDTSDAEKKSKIIKDTLKSFDIDVDIEDTKVGSSVTQYQLKTKSVTKISRISSLHDNIALAVASPNGQVRIEAPIPGKSLIGIEVPNINRSTVYFKPLVTSDAMKAVKSKLGIVLGKDVTGRTFVYDIAKMPHILIAGTTGSGKSIFIHNIMLSLLYRANPQEVKFILVDPKRVEFTYYEGLPHLVTPVVTEMEQGPSVFNWASNLMDKRYKLFAQAKVSNLEGYNERSGIQAMPYIVIVVDELGDIMLKDQSAVVEKAIVRIARLGRAAGIHLVLAVQRPEVKVVTGMIKANIACRVAFNVASQTDSRVIIDQSGAEKLLGKGDMLFIPPDITKPTRLQGAFVTYDEVKAVVNFIRSQGIEPEYDEEVLNMAPDRVSKGGGKSDWGDDVDDEFDEAVEVVQSIGKASASLLQRKMKVGYAKAARLIDSMEEKGIVGPAVSGSRARQVLIPGSNGSSQSISDEEFLDGLDEAR